MGNSNYLHVAQAFPDDNVPNHIKDSLETGTKVGRAIAAQWHNNQFLSFRRWWIDEMRQYSRGEQSTVKYKRIIEGVKPNEEATEGEKIKNYKIDYDETLKILPSFKDIIINAINEEDFKPKAEATDRTSVNERKQHYKDLEVAFYTKDIAMKMQENLGIPLVPDNLPEDSQELDARKLEYKPAIEEAQEVAIDAWMRFNNFERIKDKHDEDLFDLGFAVGRVITDHSQGIITEYVDPYNFVHNMFEMDDGRDIRYVGLYKKRMIGAIIAKLPISVRSNSEKMKELKDRLYEAAGAKTSLDDNFIDGEDNDRLVEVVEFEYLTTREIVFKKLRKNKSLKLVDRTNDPEGYNPDNPNKRIGMDYVTWFRGVYVPAIDLCIEWDEIENQIVDGANRPIGQFVIFAPKVKRNSEKGNIRFDSMVQRAKPIVDDLHRDWYKFMQLKMELRPATIEIDTQAIKDVMLGGEKIDSKKILELFFGRSILLKRIINEEGDPIPQAITENPGGVNNNSIVLLSQEFANNYNRLRQLMGINELRDGTTRPNDRTAVGVQKLLLASSNNATNHLVKASFGMSLKYAEAISYRLTDMLENESLRNLTEEMIGTKNTELIDKIKDIPMHRFSIYHDFVPDSEERLAFEQSLIDAFKKGEINVGIYNRARLIRNTKSAVKYLEYHVAKEFERKQAEKNEALRLQSVYQAEGSAMVEKEKQKTLNLQMVAKRNELILSEQLKRGGKRIDALLGEVKAVKDHERTKEITVLEGQAWKSKEGFRQDRMDDRENLKTENKEKIIDKKEKGQEVVTETRVDEFASNIDRIFKANSLPALGGQGDLQKPPSPEDIQPVAEPEAPVAQEEGVNQAQQGVQ